jgi:hypothetical protein
MFDWIQKKIGKRSSHPMRGAAEATKLLAELSGEPLQAVEELSAWLESLASATSFSTDNRLQVISVVDETGQPMVEELTHLYLAAEAKLEPGRFRQWQALVDFWDKLADAYQFIALQAEASKREDLAGQIPVVTVRAMRAIFHQMRLALMRYAGGPERAWPSLYHLYAFAHDRRQAATPVRPYPGDTLATTPRLELVRAVMLEAAAPQSLPPREIDLTARITARLASSFAYGEAPGPQLNYYVDLAQTQPPHTVPKDLQATPTMRFFGPGAAAVRLNELLEGARAPRAGADQPYSEDFTPAERIATLQRLLVYWSDSPPKRAHVRSRLSNSVDVVFGFDGITQLIRREEQTLLADESEKLNVSFDDDEKESKETEGTPVETWKLKDISLRGLGAVTTRRAQGALRIGALMAFRLEHAHNWCVGVVRRLQTDAQKNSQVGSEIFSQAPQLLWMKKLGFKQDEAWNWEVRDQKSLQHFTPGVLLATTPETGGEDCLLLKPKSYFAQESFGVMLDGKPRKLQLGNALEKGDGFERLAFKWLAVDATLQAKAAVARASLEQSPSVQAPSPETPAPNSPAPEGLSLEPLSQPPSTQPSPAQQPAEKPPSKGGFMDDAI